MSKGLFWLTAALCAGLIVFSVWQMAAPVLPAPQARKNAQTVYYLRDDKGRVAVFASGESETPLAVYNIYVNLLPQGDALRLKAGIAVTGEAALERLLEDLGA